MGLVVEAQQKRWTAMFAFGTASTNCPVHGLSDGKEGVMPWLQRGTKEFGRTHLDRRRPAGTGKDGRRGVCGLVQEELRLGALKRAWCEQRRNSIRKRVMSEAT
jgi:hypothetical protein